MKWLFIVTVIALALGATLWFLLGASARMLQPGDVVPDFSLPGSDGKTWRLADLVGKQAVVLAWFPKAFTGG